MGPKDYKILQIIPADGWYAKFSDGDGVRSVPLSCWALVEDADGDRFVIGMDCNGGDEVSFSKDPSLGRYFHKDVPEGSIRYDKSH